MNFSTLLNLHELTPFFSPSLLRKEGEGSIIQRLTPPLCEAEKGEGGEFVEKVILFGAILSYTEGLITPLLGGKKVLFPIPTISKEDVVFLKELVEKGNYKPVIDRSYSLEQIVDAYKYVETGQKIGNVVINV